MLTPEGLRIPERKNAGGGFTLETTHDARGRVVRVLAYGQGRSAEFPNEDAASAWIKRQREDLGPDEVSISPDDDPEPPRPRLRH